MKKTINTILVILTLLSSFSFLSGQAAFDNNDIILPYGGLLKTEGMDANRILRTAWSSDYGGDYLEFSVPGNNQTETPRFILSENGDFHVNYGFDIKTRGMDNNNLLLTGWDSTVGDNIKFWVPGNGAIQTSPSMTIVENGNVGIGTATPARRFHARGASSTSIIARIESQNTNGATIDFKDPNTTGNWKARIGGKGDGLTFIAGGLERMNIDADGSIRIGYPTASGYRLAVDGKVICEALRVELDQNWPDYVFEDDYELMPLEEVEKSIQEKGHLPGIPSAAEIEAEDGVDVGEMQRLMMEKIEELTLYVIDMKKENEQLKAEIQELKK